MSARKLARLSWMALALLMAGGAPVLIACQANLGGINIVREGGLAGTTQIEILESPAEAPTDFVLRTTIADSVTTEQLVKMLDRRLPLGPPAACLPQYRLRFRLADGRVEEFDYFCEGGTSFLRGSQPFWKMQEIKPPAEFDALMQRVVATLQ
jgi:hypothetical protein